MNLPGRFQNKQVRGSAFAVLLAALPRLRSIRNPQTLPSKELPSWGTAAWRRGHRSEKHCSGLVPQPLFMAGSTQKQLPPAITARGLWSSMETMFFLHPAIWRGKELRNLGFPGRGFLASGMSGNTPVAPEMLLCSTFQVKQPTLLPARCGGEPKQLPFLETGFQFLDCVLCPWLILLSFHLEGTGQSSLWPSWSFWAEPCERWESPRHGRSSPA